MGRGGKNTHLCSDCHGHGSIEKMLMLGPGIYQQMRAECSNCRGKGRIINEMEKCEKCKGERVIKMTKHLEIIIEKGIPEGFVIKLNGEGDEGLTTLPGDINFLVCFEKHEVKLLYLLILTKFYSFKKKKKANVFV